MTQTEFQAQGSGTTQCEKVLERLQATPNEWVSMPTLASFSGAYAVHSRISDLRRRGHAIEHKNVRLKGKVHSFYRLTKQPR